MGIVFGLLLCFTRHRAGPSASGENSVLTANSVAKLRRAYCAVFARMSISTAFCLHLPTCVQCALIRMPMERTGSRIGGLVAGRISASCSTSSRKRYHLFASGPTSICSTIRQGADSDKLLVTNGRAVSMRKQTTLSFPITLRPPQPFKHAVAKVRVLMVPWRVDTLPNAKMDIVNLLPS